MPILFLFILCIFSILSSSYTKISFESSIIPSAKKCITQIITKYFAEYSTVSIFTFDIHQSASLFIDIYHLSDYAKRNFNFTSFQTIFFDEHNKYCIVIGNKLKDFVTKRNIFQKLALWNARAKYIFYLLDNSDSLLQEFIDILWFYYIINSIIIIPSNDTLNIYTFYPYSSQSSCGENVTAQFIDNCKDGIFKNNIDLFPQKVPVNLNRCPVKMHSIIWSPNVLPPEDGIIKNWVPLNITEGLDVQMLTTFAKIANFTALFYSSTIPNDYGIATMAGNATGGIKIVKDRIQDIAIGSYGGMLTRRMYCDYSATYDLETMAWCVPKAQETSRWKNLFNTFNIVAWVSMFLMYLFVSFIIWTMSSSTPKDTSSFKSAKNSFLFIFAAFLGWSTSESPSKISSKITYFVWLVFGLHFVVAYQAKLITVLLNPTYEKQISSVEEMLASGMEYKIVPSHKAMFANNNDPRFTRNPEDFVICSVTNECLRQVAMQRNMAFLTLQTHAEFESLTYGRDSSGQSKIHYIFYLSTRAEWFMTKGFPLYDRLNSYIYRLGHTGLKDKWRNDILVKLLLRYRSNSEHGKENKQILTWDHMQGAFFVLIFGYSISLLIFILEKMHCSKPNVIVLILKNN